MGKYLYIAEKPSVAKEFAKALKDNFNSRDGYLESDSSVVTWCVGHLVTMSYPEVYDAAMKRWSLDTIPFLPKEFKYEVIKDVSKQFNIVKGLLNRSDVERIYVCTDSGREGEYIYRLVDSMAQVPSTKDKRRVWIDSQTEEEVLRGIREARPLSEYDNLSDAAYLRAREDYLMGINFSRVLTLKYGDTVKNFLKLDKKGAISVGRVMTCVLGMVVRREREIRAFDKTPFYRVVAGMKISARIDGEFRAVEGSKYFNTPFMYKENGFKERKTAEQMICEVSSRLGEVLEYSPVWPKGASGQNQEDGSQDKQKEPAGYRTVCNPGLLGEIVSVEKKKETKNPPLLFNLAELQNECSRLFKISPDETLNIVQELYEKKLVTYPRTDARVLSTAVAKEIDKNIRGLSQIGQFHDFAEEILASGSYKGIAKTKYTNDKQITDHYAIIPTGQGFQNLSGLKPLSAKVYEVIGRRFLSIFLPPAVYRKIALVVQIGDEKFFANFRTLMEEGWLKCAGAYRSKDRNPQGGKQNSKNGTDERGDDAERDNDGDEDEPEELGTDMLEVLEGLKKGMQVPIEDFTIRMGETAPPKRYNSGSMILAMENAGQLIEDEDLRAQIKGSGIGTSATRAEILKKLVNISYLNLNKKTQIITPTLQGELIYEVVNASIKSLLNPELTASWEKGLTYVAEGQITQDEYMQKLENFVASRTNGVKTVNNAYELQGRFRWAAGFYSK